MQSIERDQRNVPANAFGRFWRRLAQDRRANLAIIFVIALPAVLSLSGFAIDYNRSISFRVSLQNAADAAALAGARDLNTNINLPLARRSTSATEIAEKVFDAQYAIINERARFLDLEVSIDVTPEQELVVEASGRLLTTVGALAGVESVGVNVVALAESGAQYTHEIALVLDNTGSMRNDIQSLRDAANDLVDAVQEGAPSGLLKFAVVPFVTTVNVGEEFPTEFLDTSADSMHHGAWFEGRDVAQLSSCANPPSLPPGYTIRQAGSTCFIVNPAKVNVFDLFNGLRNTDWKGCVEALPEPYDVEDVTPSGDPDTKFVPYFGPDAAIVDGPQNQLVNSANSGIVSLVDGRNSWVGDLDNYWNTNGANAVRHLNRTTTNGVQPLTLAQRINYQSFNIVKYNNANVNPLAESGTPIPPLGTGYIGSGPNATCPTEILPLTDDFDAVRARINAMVPWNAGGTNTQIGASWGWKVLSPRPPFTEGLGLDRARKIMVLMTDGQNEVVTANHFTGAAQPTISDYNGLGFLRFNRTGITNAPALVGYVNERLELTCRNAKADGVTIYTVIFRVNDAPTLDLYERCATSASHAYSAASRSQLEDVFREIGESIRNLRLSL